MKVIGVTDFGGPEKLRSFDVPAPHAGPGQVRIRVAAAAVNPTDTLLRAGGQRARLTAQSPPYVPGMDAAGTIDEVGADVTGHRVGEQVMAIAVPASATKGAYTELLVVPAVQAVPIPAGTSPVEAATIPMNGLTTVLALDALGLRAGDTLAVTGAAGAVGGYAIQLGRDRGLRVLADAAPADVELVTALGADVVVARGDDVAQRFRAEAPDGVPGLVDAAVLDELAVPAVADGGGIASVRYWEGTPGRRISVHRIMVAASAHRTDLLDGLRRAAEAGVLTARVADTYPADRAADAHRRLAAGGTRGRLVLTF
ncbi:zinc-binding alcohol dehydrogenase [Actinocatenispora thailandica]|uniref:Zinc-binding alcohol dehydrogenase n=1 Tax=Actinocatenispora thailandica TaxID=227318 RepID=A0A7R7HWA7_9ACTN|nr:NADP-dependent oxidoreductase [Actinocatenispora thailandica]BCJ34683.1 zinc-binding alcohol dehydrogenase [Actinocatenispora thailandica]